MRSTNSAKTLSNEIPDCCLSPAPQLTDSRDETAWGVSCLG
jgi:hypothetical protein